MGTSGKPLDEQERERLRKLREAGLSVREIAKAERISTATVQKHLGGKPSA